MEGNGEVVPLLAVRAPLSQYLLLMEIVDLCRHLLEEMKQQIYVFFHLKTLLLCYGYMHTV